MVASAIVSTAHAQETLYAATGSKGADGVLYTVNPATSAFTAVAPILVGISPIGITGLAFDPLNGVLYGITGLESSNFPRDLVTINPSTGAATVIGGLTGTFGAVGLSDIAFRADGTLFGFSPNNLYTINLSSGALTNLGATGESTPGGGLSFSPGGTLFATAGLAASGTIDTLNTTTGARSTGPGLTNAPYAGTLGAINALTFNSLGVLYGSNSNRAQNGATVTAVELITINTATGAITDIGALPGNTDAIAFSVPEPSSSLLLMSGFVIFTAVVRRMRRQMAP
ncbi:MAG: hypothetical protein QOG48_1032 [Verrucomicrobiota bacterium]|jgi:hypothetical protein